LAVTRVKRNPTTANHLEEAIGLAGE
jgi:hypothetical protein